MGVAAERGALALGRREVLDGDGDAVQRAESSPIDDGLFRRAGLGQRLLRIDEAEAVELRIDLLDPRQRVVHQVHRRQLAPADARGQLRRRRVAEIEIGHADLPQSAAVNVRPDAATLDKPAIALLAADWACWARWAARGRMALTARGYPC